MKTAFSLFPLPLLIALGQSATARRLEHSSRQHAWVRIKSGNREISSFVTYPDVSDRAPAVIVIHEIFGLTDWIRRVTDQLAEHGYIAIAPDLISDLPVNGDEPKEPTDVDAVVKAILELPPAQVISDLDAVTEYAAQLPACDGLVSVAGFCWGGGQAFRFAAHQQRLKAAFVFYGRAPEQAEIARIHCPIYGFYGSNDARITPAVPKTIELMAEAGKQYEPVIYSGAGHGFMRAGDEAKALSADREAMSTGWKRWLDLLAGANGR